MVNLSEKSDSKTGFLHLSDLIKVHKEEPIFTTPDDDADEITRQMEKQIEADKGVAFDLRLGSQYYLSGESYPGKLKKGDYLNIEPGQFALLTTYEKFDMPVDLVAFISMRFSIKAKGLINVSGFQVDPGYRGVFIFSVYNAGPTIVPLKYKKEIFNIIFSKTSQKISEKRIPVNEIPVEKWSWLMQRKNVSLIGMNERISELEKSYERVKYLIPILVGSIAIIATILGLISSQ